MDNDATTLTYSADRIREMATPEDSAGYTVTELVLYTGETAWNPASTKGPLYGPSNIAYVMHPSGITVYENDIAKCLICDANCPVGDTRCHLDKL